jgi:hypothetical protein
MARYKFASSPVKVPLSDHLIAILQSLVASICNRPPGADVRPTTPGANLSSQVKQDGERCGQIDCSSNVRAVSETSEQKLV